MQSTVIDTLRYADHLKEAGVEAPLAEAMSRALAAEIAEGLATKADLDQAVNELTAKMDHGFTTVDARFDAMDAKFTARLDAMDAKFRLQAKYVFLVLTVVVGLGLYNAIAPQLDGGASPPGPPNQTVAPAPAPTAQSPNTAP